MKVRLEEYYKSELVEKLKKELDLANVMQVPRLVKVVVNIGVKEAVTDSKALNGAKDVLEKIVGQAAVKTKARKSIAGFKIREGMAIGVKATLRRRSMYVFLEKLINATLPAVRDFHGINLKFDGSGNYNLGLTDWMVFPEIDYDNVDRVSGLNVTIHTSADSDEHAYALLKGLGMPFKKEN